MFKEFKYIKKGGRKMKSKKILVVCILMFVLLFSIAACGSKDTSSTEDQTTVAEEVSAEPATATQTIPTPDPSATVDALLGTWVDINTPEETVNITKVGEEYQYEDKDGKYTGTFKDGKLILTVETETAEVYIDSKTGHMFTVYQDNPTEFSKK
jgi:ABC-type oligopeptide transport system substrate-binding subunit